MAWFFGITMPVMMLGLVAVPKLSQRMSKSGGIITGALVTIVGSLGLYFTPYEDIGWVFFWSCITALGGTPIAVLGWAMIPDTVEYAQWKLGLRADGAIFAFSSFFQKLAKALGGAGVAGALALVGYVANAEQSEQSLRAIHNLLTLVPASLMLVMIIAARSYTLDRATHQQILRELT